jgi:hypothetical protein
MSSTCFEPRVHLQVDSCMCGYGMVRFTRICISSLVGRKVCSILRSRKLVKCRFIFYNYITAHGVKNITFNCRLYRCGFSTVVGVLHVSFG